MTSPRKKSKVTSIQAIKRRGFKSSTAYLNAKTAAQAYRSGLAWDDNEVSRLVQGIDGDESTYDMAISLGRTLYGVMNARAHVAFAMRHQAALFGTKKKAR